MGYSFRRMAGRACACDAPATGTGLPVALPPPRRTTVAAPPSRRIAAFPAYRRLPGAPLPACRPTVYVAGSWTHHDEVLPADAQPTPGLISLLRMVSHLLMFPSHRRTFPPPRQLLPLVASRILLYSLALSSYSPLLLWLFIGWPYTP